MARPLLFSPLPIACAGGARRARVPLRAAACGALPRGGGSGAGRPAASGGPAGGPLPRPLRASPGLWLPSSGEPVPARPHAAGRLRRLLLTSVIRTLGRTRFVMGCCRPRHERCRLREASCETAFRTLLSPCARVIPNCDVTLRSGKFSPRKKTKKKGGFGSFLWAMANFGEGCSSSEWC